MAVMNWVCGPLRLQPIIVFALVLRYGAGVSVVAAQEEGRCAPADRFLTEELVMVTRIDPDTLDDWRTGKRLAACRITGGGARRTTLAVAARVFFEKVRAAGWTRTPDPRDSPNEASLRFRLGETDCLFNVYQGILLGTDSEIEVTNAVETRPGEELYHVLVLCVPAMEAQPLSVFQDASRGFTRAAEPAFQGTGHTRSPFAVLGTHPQYFADTPCRAYVMV